MGVFNNRKLYGADGYDARRWSLDVNQQTQRPRFRNMVDSIGTRYRALGNTAGGWKYGRLVAQVKDLK